MKGSRNNIDQEPAPNPFELRRANLLVQLWISNGHGIEHGIHHVGNVCSGSAYSMVQKLLGALEKLLAIVLASHWPTGVPKLAQGLMLGLHGNQVGPEQVRLNRHHLDIPFLHLYPNAVSERQSGTLGYTIADHSCDRGRTRKSMLDIRE